MKIHKKYSHLLFTLIMSFLTAFIMSGALVALFSVHDAPFILQWMRAFIHAWPIAFPVIFVLGPIVRKIVSALTE